MAKQIQINPITPDLRNQIKTSVNLVSNVETERKPLVKKMEDTYESYKVCSMNF